MIAGDMPLYYLLNEPYGHKAIYKILNNFSKTNGEKCTLLWFIIDDERLNELGDNSGIGDNYLKCEELYAHNRRIESEFETVFLFMDCNSEYYKSDIAKKYRADVLRDIILQEETVNYTYDMLRFTFNDKRYCIALLSNSKRKFYETYLKSKKWTDFKAKVIGMRGFNCELCKSQKNIQLHHLTYERLGKEDINDVMILCKKCHEKAHKLQ